MEDYKPNSNRFKEKDGGVDKKPMDGKKIEKVIKGTATTRKKSKLESFVAEDISNVKQYVISDVLLPTLKKALSDVVSNGLDMILFGEVQDRRRRGSSSTSTRSTVSYDRYYDRDKDRDQGRSRDTSRSRIGYDYEEVVVSSRVEADDVLGILDEVIDTYGSVSVGDLYDAVGMVGNYTDYKYGWTDLRTAKVEPVRDGFVIRTPRAVALKKIDN